MRFDNLAKKRERKKKKKGKGQDGTEKILAKEKEEEEEVVGGSLQYIEKRIEDGNLGEVVSAIRDMGVSVEKEVMEAGACNGDDSCTTEESEETSGIRVAKDLDRVLENGVESYDKRLLLISLHSCGNLVHHALKAFIATPEVKAIALIGIPRYPVSWVSMIVLTKISRLLLQLNDRKTRPNVQTSLPYQAP